MPRGRWQDGVRLTPIAERDEWVWCCVPRPNHNYVVVGCNDGSITMYQLIFATVHGLYRERYAFREYMTDVVVQQLATEQKVRIKCKNYVKKIAIYKDRLAVLLPERLHIYELPPEDASSELAPRLRDKIALKSECSQLLILSSHFVVCNGKRLMLHAFSGGREREWQFEAAVRYIKPIGGPPSREGMLVGLDDGEVYEVFLNNDFPISIVKHGKCIRCLDISASRRKLAVVDDEACLTVYDMATGAVAFKEADASSVAWNNDVDDMLAFSHNGTLSIKTAGFPLHQQRQRGVVVGFKGSKIFCLHYVNMQAVDVPQSASLYRYLEVKDFEAAHAIACLGVTNDDWRELGMEALKALSFDVARRAFVRLKDVRWIDLIRSLEERKKQPGTDDAVLTGTVMAYAGKFQEAAKLFTKANRADLAIEMFTDLRRWDEARAYSHGAADTGAAAELMQKQAAWAAEVDNPSVAAETYLAAGDTLKAIGILGEQGWLDKLHEVARKLGKSATDELRACLGWFEKHGATERAREVLLKMGDVGGIISLHVSNGQWADALALAKEHPQFAAQVHLPYAQWLVEQDRFDEAQAAFRQAGQAERCVAMLQARNLHRHRSHNNSSRRVPRADAHAQRGARAAVRGGGPLPVAPRTRVTHRRLAHLLLTHARRAQRPRLRQRAFIQRAAARARPAARGGRQVLALPADGRPVLRVPVDPQVHRRPVHRALLGHRLLHRAVPPLVAAQGRGTPHAPLRPLIPLTLTPSRLTPSLLAGALRYLEGVLHLRAREAVEGARREQARALRAREARAVPRACTVAGPGRPLRVVHPLAPSRRLRGAPPLVLPLPDDQPSAQPG